MNNKGFTMIEMIAAIVVIAIISLIITPIITSVINENKVKNCQNIVKSIENATNNYVSDRRYSNIPNSITIKELKDLGYLKGTVTDTTKENDTESKHLNESITITWNSTSKTYTYKYNGSITCDK